jgi:hypothetical protein
MGFKVPFAAFYGIVTLIELEGELSIPAVSTVWTT